MLCPGAWKNGECIRLRRQGFSTGDEGELSVHEAAGNRALPRQGGGYHKLQREITLTKAKTTNFFYYSDRRALIVLLQVSTSALNFFFQQREQFKEKKRKKRAVIIARYTEFIRMGKTEVNFVKRGDTSPQFLFKRIQVVGRRKI